MTGFIVRLEETLSKEVYVEAENKHEAFDKVFSLYKDSKIILSAEDFVKADYEVLEV